MQKSKIYAVCENLQHNEIKEYCFNKCGKVQVAGLDYNDLAWWLCELETCPYLDRQINSGDKIQDDELWLRKLVVKEPLASHLNIKRKEYPDG